MNAQKSSASATPSASKNLPPEPGGFAKLPKTLLTVWPYMPEHHLRLLPLLLSFWSKDGEMFPGQGDLGTLAGISRQWTNTTLDELVDVGLLTTHPRRRKDGFNSTCEYRKTNWDSEAVVAAVIAAYVEKFPRRKYGPPKWVNHRPCQLPVDSNTNEHGRTLTSTDAPWVQLPVDSRCQLPVDSPCQPPVDSGTYQMNGPVERTSPPLRCAAPVRPTPPEGDRATTGEHGDEAEEVNLIDLFPALEFEAEEEGEDWNITYLEFEEVPNTIPASNHFNPVPHAPAKSSPEVAPTQPTASAGAAVMDDPASWSEEKQEAQQRGEKLYRYVRNKERTKANKPPRRKPVGPS